jgi:hypothetical protein
MKKQSSIFLISMFMLVVFSCHQEEIEQQQERNISDFKITDIKGQTINTLPTDLLESIHQDLIRNKRNQDAQKLFESYDRKTGILKNYTSKQSTSNGRTEDVYEINLVYSMVHVGSLGDLPPCYQTQVADGNPPFSYCGTTGENRRLEGMSFQTDASLFTTRPALFYTLRNPDGSWTPTGTWGDFVGTRGQSKATIGLKMWSTTANYHIWYRAHNQSTGWNQAWQTDGAFAGVFNKRLEAFAFQILYY